MSDVINTQDTGNTATTETLYLGKFKKIEDLENGYTQLEQTYTKTAAEKKQLEDKFRTPEDYSVLANHSLSDSDLSSLRDEAKSAALTQDQFNQLIKKRSDEKEQHIGKIKKLRDDLGEDKVNVLKDYVDKHYPPLVRAEMLEKVMLNEQLRLEAFQHRERTLNNHVPNHGTPPDVYTKITHSELLELGREAAAKPNDVDLQNRYIKRTAQYVAQNKKSDS